MNSKNQIISNTDPSLSTLEQRAITQLESRLASNRHYTSSEVVEIEELDRRLIPTDIDIDEGTTKKLRALCKLSQCELKPAREITSHRPFIGPIIVAIKKLSWPLIKIHLKEAFAGQQEFNSWAVYSIAENSVENIRLKNKLNS